MTGTGESKKEETNNHEAHPRRPFPHAAGLAERRFKAPASRLKKSYRGGEKQSILSVNCFLTWRNARTMLCVVRSLHGTNPAHGGALLKLRTGSDTSERSSLGSWIMYGLGTENKNLPGFISICPTFAHGGVNNWGSAFLPAHCHGTPIGNLSISAEKAVVRHMNNLNVPRNVQRIQLDALLELNRSHSSQSGADAALQGRIQSFELRFRMQMAMPEAQNVELKSAATKRLFD